MSVNLFLKHAVKPCKVNEKKLDMQVFANVLLPRSVPSRTSCKKKCRNVFVGLKKNANFACGESLENKHTALNER